MKFEKVKPGMTLYDRHSYRMGNTTMRTIGEWRVEVLSVDLVARTAQCRWNGNAPRTYDERHISALKPWSMYDPGVEVQRGAMGRVLKVTRPKR